MNRRSFVRFVGVCFGFGPSVISAAGLAQLSSRASAVVVGTASARYEQPSQVEFDLSVEGVLAGTVPGTSVHVVHRGWASLIRQAPVTLNDRYRGVWFLVGGVSQGWDVLVARPSAARTMGSLYLPVPPGPLAYPAGAVLVDVLAQAVASGASTEYNGAEVLRGAIEATDSPAVRGVLQQCLASVNADFEAVGLAGLLERQEPGSIGLVDRMWPLVAASAERRAVLSAIRNYWRAADPASVGGLVELAQAAPDPELRFSAVWALAAIHSRATLPFLSTLLQSTNVDEQAQAMYGISAFANGCPVKAHDTLVSMTYIQCAGHTQYATDETMGHFTFGTTVAEKRRELVAFWQQWWNAHPELH